MSESTQPAGVVHPFSIASSNGSDGSGQSSRRNVKIILALLILVVVVIGVVILLVLLPSPQTQDMPSTKEPVVATATPEDFVPGTGCDRVCTEGDIRSCVFDWEVSYYYTMLNNTRTNKTKPCGKCPTNQQDCTNDGCVTLNGLKRPVVTVNRQVPGPKIIVCKGDAIIVNVANMLNDMTGITFHWHGLNQFRTPAMDGPSMITQCPIPFATTFTYKIIANEPGTYFWHSHIGSNRADGLAGPIVIREVNDPHRNTYDVDDSNHTVMIQDWMKITQNTNYMAYLYGEGQNQPDFLLINGKGKGPATNGSFVPREVFHVERSLRYRIRVISNAFTGCQMRVSVDSHKLLAINMDSYPINPVPFDALISNAGERFDFVLHANQSIGNYWLRVVGVGDNCKSLPLQELAIVRYRGAPNEDPTTPERPVPYADDVLNAPARSSVNATSFIRIINMTSLIQFSPDANVNRYYLPLGLENPKRSDSSLRDKLPQINHITFTFPPVPLLTQHDEVDQSFFCDAREAGTWTNCTDFQCQCTQIISVDLHQTVELFFYNGIPQDNTCHPMHLHGFSYRIVGMGLLNTTDDTPAEIQRRDMNGEFPRLQTNFPPNKDTICVAHGSYLILQFVADNPGWWFLHCHLDFHALIGMAMVVRVGTDEDLQGLIPPNFPRCNNFGPPDLPGAHEDKLTMVNVRSPF